MRYYFRNLFSSLIAADLLCNVSFVSAGLIPSRRVGRSLSYRQTSSPSTYALPGLDALKSYIFCEPCTTGGKREVEVAVRAGIPVDISEADATALLAEVKLLISQVEQAMTDKGIAIPTGSKRRDASSTVITLPPGSILNTYVCPVCTKKRQSPNAMSASMSTSMAFNVTMADLPSFWTQLQALLAQLIQALLGGAGLNIGSALAGLIPALPTGIIPALPPATIPALHTPTSVGIVIVVPTAAVTPIVAPQPPVVPVVEFPPFPTPGTAATPVVVPAVESSSAAVSGTVPTSVGFPALPPILATPPGPVGTITISTTTTVFPSGACSPTTTVQSTIFVPLLVTNVANVDASSTATSASVAASGTSAANGNGGIFFATSVGSSSIIPKPPPLPLGPPLVETLVTVATSVGSKPIVPTPPPGPVGPPHVGTSVSVATVGPPVPIGTPVPVGTFVSVMTRVPVVTPALPPVGTPVPTSPATGYIFNSQSTKNIAVYFGQTPVTGGSSLLAQCADPDIDIAILAFIIAKEYQGTKYPLINFGAACGGQTPAMISQAPGLLNCPDLASNILQCQQTYGKKVFLSIGGATSGIIFTSDSDAIDFGDVLWQLFGPPGSIDVGLRPFGNVVIDGFDIDNENDQPQHYDTLAIALRSNYAHDNSKKYYLSSAPQCPSPDASNPIGMLLLCDFVWVQFYNNPNCEIGSNGFVDSMRLWSSNLAASTLSPRPRFYLGAPAFPAAGQTAYQHIGSAEGMKVVAQQAEGLGLSNFGGVMLWDGPEGMLNTEGGKNIISWAKAGLS